jgi:hypothetical protein
MRILVTILVLAGALAVAADTPEAAAVKSAESWVAFVDSGKYAESWNQAGADFRKAVTLEKWVQAVKSVREPLGKLNSRKPSTTQAVNDPPGAPAGQYVICLFDSTFENKTGAVETIVMFLEADKQWRTSGYFIK